MEDIGRTIGIGNVNLPDILGRDEVKPPRRKPEFRPQLRDRRGLADNEVRPNKYEQLVDRGVKFFSGEKVENIVERKNLSNRNIPYDPKFADLPDRTAFEQIAFDAFGIDSRGGGVNLGLFNARTYRPNDKALEAEFKKSVEQRRASQPSTEQLLSDLKRNIANRQRTDTNFRRSDGGDKRQFDPSTADPDRVAEIIQREENKFIQQQRSKTITPPFTPPVLGQELTPFGQKFDFEQEPKQTKTTISPVQTKTKRSSVIGPILPPSKETLAQKQI